MRQMAKLIIIFLSILYLPSCAWLIPYEENFACDTKKFGRCVNVTDAYEHATTGKDVGQEIYLGDKNTKKKTSVNEVPPESHVSEYRSYKENVYKELKEKIQRPQAPVYNQAKVAKTFVLSYKTESEGSPFYMDRYVYYFIDQPRWVMGETDKRNKTNYKSLSPIEENLTD